MNEPPTDIRAILEQQLTEEVFLRLVLYARRRMSCLTWQGVKGGQLADCASPEDVVQEAILRVYEGKRPWDRSKCPELFRFLRGVVRSLISTLVNGKENARFLRESTLAASIDQEEGGTSLGIDTLVPDLSEDILTIEHERLANEFACGFLDFLNDEPELQKVAEGALDLKKPSEIAESLGMKPTDLSNLRKKLQRRMRDYQALRDKTVKGGDLDG